MVTVSRTVEYYLADAGSLGPLGDELSDRLAPGHLAGALGLDPLGAVAHAEQRHAPVVVHQLGVDVLEGAKHHQPGTLGSAGHLAADPEVPAAAQLGAALGRMNRAHAHLAPVLPALRRTCSP